MPDDNMNNTTWASADGMTYSVNATVDGEYSGTVSVNFNEATQTVDTDGMAYNISGTVSTETLGTWVNAGADYIGEATAVVTTVKEAKGGVYAPADTKLIRESLSFYLNNKFNISDAEERQIANLIHRIDSRL